MGGDMAGESARQVAREARARAERLQRRADLFEQGAEGETATADVLGTLPPEWTAIHDVRWPGRRLANVDHVLLGPGGIFVIDSKNWSGDITVDVDRLRQNGRSRDRAVSSAADAALAVSELVAPHAAHVYPVICFAGETDLAGWCRDVMICSTGNLRQMLLSRPHRLGPAEQIDGWLRLDAQLRAAAGATAPGREGRRTAARTRVQARLEANPLAMATAPRRVTRRSRQRKARGSLVRLLLALTMTLAMLVWGPTVTARVGPALAELITRDLTANACGEPSTTATEGRQVEKEERDGRDSKGQSRQQNNNRSVAAANGERPREGIAC